MSYFILSIVLLSLSTFSCKPKVQQGSETQTLGNLSSADAFKMNQCYQSNESTRSLFYAEDSTIALYANERVEFPSSMDKPWQQEGFKNILAAVPKRVLQLFFQMKGKIVLDPNLNGGTLEVCEELLQNIESSGLLASALTFQERKREEIHYCMKKSSEGNEFVLYLDANPGEGMQYPWLKHSTVRAFGSFFTEFLVMTSVNVNSQGQLDVNLAQDKSVIMKEIATVAEAFRKDFEKLKNQGKDLSSYVDKLNLPNNKSFSSDQVASFTILTEAFDSYYCSDETRESMSLQFSETHQVMEQLMRPFDGTSLVKSASGNCIVGCDLSRLDEVDQRVMTAYRNSKSGARSRTQSDGSVYKNNSSSQSQNQESENKEKSSWWGSAMSTVGGVLLKVGPTVGGVMLAKELGVKPEAMINLLNGVAEEFGGAGAVNVDYEKCRKFYQTNDYTPTQYAKDFNVQLNEAEKVKTTCDKTYNWQVLCTYYDNISQTDTKKYELSGNETGYDRYLKEDWQSRKSACQTDWKRECYYFTNDKHKIEFPENNQLVDADKEKLRKEWGERSQECQKKYSWSSASSCDYFNYDSDYQFDGVYDWGKTDEEKQDERKRFDQRADECKKQKQNSSVTGTTPQYNPTPNAGDAASPKTSPRKFEKKDSGGCGVISMTDHVESQSAVWFLLVLFGLPALIRSRY